MQTIQERIQKESEFYAKNQKEMQKLLENRQKLDAQINDNKLVKEVLDELEVRISTVSWYLDFVNVNTLDILEIQNSITYLIFELTPFLGFKLCAISLM